MGSARNVWPIQTCRHETHLILPYLRRILEHANILHDMVRSDTSNTWFRSMHYCVRGISKSADWSRGNFHHATLLFPLDGLATKVLGDRIAELLELTEMMTPETFVSRFFPIPIVPRVGFAAKMVSCLHHRSTILGSDLAPVKHPVQYVHAIERRLTKICRRVTRAVGEPEVPLSWPVVENVLCCFSKVWECNLDVGSHAVY